MASTKKSKEEEKRKKKKKENAIGTPKPWKLNHENGKSNTKDKKKKKNATEEEDEDDDVVLVPSTSSSDSQQVIEIVEEEEKGVKKRKGKARDGDNEEEGEEGTMCRFPMARVKRIMKGEGPNLQAGRDIVFLVNKATEKFLEQFAEEAYECSVRDRKKSLAYKHLSSVVREEERFDFLKDYVPEKLTAEDALAERKLAETAQE